MNKSRCTFLGNTTSIQVLYNHPTSMTGQRKSTILLDLQIFQIHRTSFQWRKSIAYNSYAYSARLLSHTFLRCQTPSYGTIQLFIMFAYQVHAWVHVADHVQNTKTNPTKMKKTFLLLSCRSTMIIIRSQRRIQKRK